VSGAAATFVQTVWFIVTESAVWLLVSLVVGGVVHEFLPASRLQRLLARHDRGAMGGAVLLGACLPMCSCGVIPLAVSLYRSGVRLGPVMAFAAATPIINPAAVILSLALLGPEITVAYVALGLLLPLLMGAACERWGERSAPPAASGAPDACCADTAAMAPPPSDPLAARMGRALRWGLLDLGPTIGYYMAIGLLLAGLIAVAVPHAWAQAYMNSGHGAALAAAGALGALVYVCAVAHIPLVATLVSASATPGVAIVFLVTGTATNLPELFALYRAIGRRTVLIYTATLVAGAVVAGALVNAWLLPGFEPVFDPIASLTLLERAENLQFTVGATLSTAAAWSVAALAALGTGRRVAAAFRARRGADICCSS
jgi:uncharacterized membrane protein YraQ (UPF0718 family)